MSILLLIIFVILVWTVGPIMAIGYLVALLIAFNLVVEILG